MLRAKCTCTDLLPSSGICLPIDKGKHHCEDNHVGGSISRTAWAILRSTSTTGASLMVARFLGYIGAVESDVNTGFSRKSFAKIFLRFSILGRSL
jgi:hypothetical protein